MKSINILRLLSSIFLLSTISCKENIDINTSDSPPQIVIYGYISTDTTQHQIRISRSAGFFSTARPEGVSNADVSITSGEKAFPLVESTEEPGLYLTSPDVYGISGETYTLHVSTDFYGSGRKEKYEASSLLPFASRPDSIKIMPSPLAKNFLQVLLWGETPAENDINFISIHLFRNGIIVNDSLRGISTADDQFVADKYIKGVPIFMLNQERDRYKLASGDTLTLQLSSITRDYASFISSAQWESHGSVPLFGGPPANIQTNISCTSNPEILSISGFFTAFSIRRTSMIYTE
jgi:hypothetical protein